MKKRVLVVRRPACMGRRVARYGECRKNHAASVGGYSVDGCREFMADGEEGTSGALQCAVCGCHRSFHRRVQECDVACDCSSPTAARQWDGC